ncbi:MAG: feruloyl-CoA synthase [Sedimentitalea sp.]
MDERYLDHRVTRLDRTDGTILLTSDYDVPQPARRVGDWLDKWALRRPDTVFLAERSGEGWRTLAYGDALAQVRALAAGLLARGLNSNTPVLILSGNSVDHGLLAMAAQYVGIPVVPVAEQYALVPGALKQLVPILRLIDPRMVFAADGARFASALEMEQIAGRDIVVGQSPGAGHTLLSDLMQADTRDVADAARQVGPETIAKILMTSGSTSDPKGVITTHGMLCTNQAQYQAALPFLGQRAPCIVDWLPWNHTFGGSSNFNQILANGGSLYIDDGKPVKGLVGRTFENVQMVPATMAYNVPVGFALLRDEMRTNTALREAYFKDLDMIFYAGASLPRDVWDDLIAMAVEVRGETPFMTTCWGLTETAPACLFQHHPTVQPGVLGVPMAGVTTKLVPEDGARFDVRVKGANVMPGYFREPVRTAEAFDEEGFFITGDAMCLVDPNDPAKGLRFDGRISEDFKLATGVWVRATQLRLEMLVALAGIAADVIITGEGRDEVGVLIVPLPTQVADLAEDDGAIVPGQLRAVIERALASQSGRGNSNMIRRALILAQPPMMAEAELTAKGNLNFRKVLVRRQALVDRLYSRVEPCVMHYNADE